MLITLLPCGTANQVAFQTCRLKDEDEIWQVMDSLERWLVIYSSHVQFQVHLLLTLPRMSCFHLFCPFVHWQNFHETLQDCG